MNTMQVIKKDLSELCSILVKNLPEKELFLAKWTKETTEKENNNVSKYMYDIFINNAIDIMIRDNNETNVAKFLLPGIQFNDIFSDSIDESVQNTLWVIIQRLYIIVNIQYRIQSNLSSVSDLITSVVANVNSEIERNIENNNTGKKDVTQMIDLLIRELNNTVHIKQLSLECIHKIMMIVEPGAKKEKEMTKKLLNALMESVKKLDKNKLGDIQNIISSFSAIDCNISLIEIEVYSVLRKTRSQWEHKFMYGDMLIQIVQEIMKHNIDFSEETISKYMSELQSPNNTSIIPESLIRYFPESIQSSIRFFLRKFQSQNSKKFITGSGSGSGNGSGNGSTNAMPHDRTQIKNKLKKKLMEKKAAMNMNRKQEPPSQNLIKLDENHFEFKKDDNNVMEYSMISDKK